jgi:eukaryotic-like serine/threonine-protein kinase
MPTRGPGPLAEKLVSSQKMASVHDNEIRRCVPPAGAAIEPRLSVNADPAEPPQASRESASGPGPAPPVGLPHSLTSETNELRRRRLIAVAIFLAVMYGLVTLWLFVSDNAGTLTAEGSRFSLRVGLTGLRCLLAAAAAGLLATGVALSHRQVRVVEYLLFLGLTAFNLANQYFVGFDLIRRSLHDPELYIPVYLTFHKDGVIAMILLMVMYGTLIPNPASIAARALVVMFLGTVAVQILHRVHPDVAPNLARLLAAEDYWYNGMFLAIGMALATYGAYLTHGLRAQLYRARKLGQYRLIRKLGEGGMGKVYLAEHELLKRPCALKLIKTGDRSDPLALARFEREVRSAARLSHPNTIEIFDYGRADDGTFYYVMEYLQGLTLLELVRKAGPLPPGRVIYLFRQVCAGLAEAHGLGLVHRDLKPANVFVALRGGESDVAKVLDFGIVKLTQDPDAVALTTAGSLSGTPLFMAPEQAMDDGTLDARADIYALGAVMYFALTGRPPFLAKSAMAVIAAHLRDPVVPPSRHRPGLPEDLEQVILRCLAKQPDERFCSVKVLGEALAACASANDWAPSRADAWWVAESMQAGPSNAPACCEADGSEGDVTFKFGIRCLA